MVETLLVFIFRVIQYVKKPIDLSNYLLSKFMKTERGTYSNPTYQAKFSALLFLLIASILASAAGIPYAYALLSQSSSIPSMSSMLEGASLNFILLTLPLTVLGLWLGSKVGLGAPKLTAIFAKVPGSYHRLRSLVISATVLGIVGGISVFIINILFSPFLPSELLETEIPGFFPALFGSFSAAVNEEIWMRLGVMTCLVWLGSKLTRQRKPGKILMWSANFLAVIGFAALHIPQASILAEEITPLLLIYILLGNGVIGLIFGWLYWRRGLLAAMIAHFSTDIVIHVVPTLFGTGIK